MKLHLIEMLVTFKQSQERITFGAISYFHGQMGAGKSTIARLIDYCFGAKQIEMTPAMQSEFVAVTLAFTVNGSEVYIHRQRDTFQVQAQWSKDSESFEAIIPLDSKKEEVVPGAGVETLSDFLFYLAGTKPPRVRKSKSRDDSEIVRLSFRDIFWYCYLDQDEIDSNFFNLDPEANPFKRNKSRDVLRFVVGFHQERVAELESQLEEVRTQRLAMAEAAKALKQALESVDVASEEDIQIRVQRLREELEQVEQQIAKTRENGVQANNHAVDQLRQRGRDLANEIEATDQASASIKGVLADYTRHLGELTTLSVKFRRTTSARAVLNNVEFERCPRCGQILEPVEAEHCRLCGQPDVAQEDGGLDIEVTSRDVSARTEELRDLISRHRVQLVALERRQRELTNQKERVDTELNEAMRQYDSAYLSSSLALERQRAALQQEAIELERLRRLSHTIAYQVQQADILQVDEARIRIELREARAAAERDSSNLRRLEQLFLDCLVRARVPGFSNHDQVSIQSPSFLPQVTSPEAGELINTSFANLGSGGKKTLFKICFSIAVHRLAVEINGFMPTLLVIDSPMKNISERENREQYEGLHELLYELSVSELNGTQIIMVDKEFCPPPQRFVNDIDLVERRMTPDDPGAPPLIHYYRGH